MFKQPHVPEYGGNALVGQTLIRLILFLRDFCTDVWKANNKRVREIKELKDRLDALTGGE